MNNTKDKGIAMHLNQIPVQAKRKKIIDRKLMKQKLGHKLC